MKVIDELRDVWTEGEWFFQVECWFCSHVDNYRSKDLKIWAKQIHNWQAHYENLNDEQKILNELTRKRDENFLTIDPRFWNYNVNVRVKCKDCSYQTQAPVTLTSDLLWMYKAKQPEKVKTFCRARKEQVETFISQYKRYYDLRIEFIKKIFEAIPDNKPFTGEIKEYINGEREIYKRNNWNFPKNEEHSKARSHLQFILIGKEIEKLREEKALYIANRYGLELDTPNHE